MSRHALLFSLASLAACDAGSGDAALVPGPDASPTPAPLTCTTRAETTVPQTFRGADYVPAMTVTGSVTYAGHTWPVSSASLSMEHTRDPDLADRCVVMYSVVAFIDPSEPGCVLAMRFINSGDARNFQAFAFDTSSCSGVPAAAEVTWSSATDEVVAAEWPTLTGGLLDEDAVKRCELATVTFPDVVLPVGPQSSLTLSGFTVSGPFASRQSAVSPSPACDTPIYAHCWGSEPIEHGVCPLP
jgi:hypothetical protein